MSIEGQVTWQPLCACVLFAFLFEAQGLTGTEKAASPSLVK